MNKDVQLIMRARVAAGISWDAQEPEVRRILRECADRMLRVNENDGFVDTTCEACGCRMLVKLDDNCPATFCPPCGGGCVCAAYGKALEKK